MTQLVGRQEELDLLLRRWWKATEGEGQVVLLSGELGIGKSQPNSRPIRAPRNGAAHAAALFLLPQHTDSALSNHQSVGTSGWLHARR